MSPPQGRPSRRGPPPEGAGGQGANGTGFSYQGVFYVLSGAEVRPERLGDVVAEGVPFRETTTDVRLITRVGADLAVAARIGLPSDDHGPERHAWLLLSPRPELAADPRADERLAPAIQPSP